MVQLRKQQFVVYAVLIVLICPLVGRAKSLDFEYPELQVTPPASQRVGLEAKEEDTRRTSNYLPMQISAAMSLVSGISLSQDSKETASSREVNIASGVGIGMGGFWLGLTYWLSSSYTPFADAQQELKKMPNKTRQQRLARERVAEEHMQAAAQLGRKLMYLSVASHLLTSAYVGSLGQQTTSVIAGASMLAAFAPLLFAPRWIQVHETHLDYKRKIYGPIVEPGSIQDPVSGRWMPGVLVSFQW